MNASVPEQYAFPALEPGEQMLCTVPPMESVISHLPPEAFANLLIISPRVPQKVEKLVRRAGGNPKHVGHIPLSSSSHNYSGPLWATPAVDPSDLTQLGIMTNLGLKYVSSDTGWVVFDNLNALLIYAGEDRAYRFLHLTTQRLVERNIRGCFAFSNGGISADTRALMLGLFDSTTTIE